MGKNCGCHTDLLSASSVVTGSNTLLLPKFPSGAVRKMVIDLGIFQEKENEDYNRSLIFDPKEIDAAFITHAHADHIGRLPMMTKYGYNGKIYTSEDTKTLFPIALEDSQKIQKTRAKRNNRPLPFDLKDVSDTCKVTVGCAYNKWYSVDDNVRFMLLGNGHLVGAAMIVISITDFDGQQMNFLFTGDYAPDNMFFDVPEIPEEITQMPLNIITEATYGSTDSTDNAEPVFVNNVTNAARKKHTIVIPAFSLGRVQEMLNILKVMQSKELLDISIPIFLDGRLAVEYTKLFKNGQLNISEEMRDFLPDNFHFVTTIELREGLLKSKKQKIIITTSGMGTYGPAQTYIPHYTWDPKALIHFTGYCAKGTYGRKLKESQEGDFFFTGNGGLLEVKKAQVEFTAEFSKHAKADQLIDLLRKFKNIKSIIVNHGEMETKQIFAKRIYEELGIRKVGVLSRNVGFRIGEYGIIKPIAGAE